MNYIGMKIVKAVTAWSFSRWKDYEKCPAYFGFKHVRRLPEPKHKAMERGTAVHKLGEDYLRGAIKEVPPEYGLFADGMRELRALKAVPEGELAFTKGWKDQTEWDNWTKAWVRVKADAMARNLKKVILKIIDFKTGKIYDDHRIQLSLYGVAGLVMEPSFDVVHGEAWYLDQGGDPVVEEFHRKNLPVLMKDWDKRTKKMLADETFKPKPSDYACRYCTFSKKNGGSCPAA